MSDINESIRKIVDTIVYARVYVQENLDNLRSQYGERYLAIAHADGVVDSDEDKNSLIQRLQKSNDQRGIIIDTISNLIKPNLSNN